MVDASLKSLPVKRFKVNVRQREISSYTRINVNAKPQFAGGQTTAVIYLVNQSNAHKYVHSCLINQLLPSNLILIVSKRKFNISVSFCGRWW